MDKEAIDIGQISRKEFNPMPALFTDDDVREQIEISKELFLVVSCLQTKPCFGCLKVEVLQTVFVGCFVVFLLQVIQDHSVQSLMDDLDLPPDRANLFEVIDADGVLYQYCFSLADGKTSIVTDGLIVVLYEGSEGTLPGHSL